MACHDDTHSSGEETPLIPRKRTKQPTPLPWGQISIIMLLQVCEPLTNLSISPYINQLISELDITGGNERKVGYYAGLIGSLFYLTQAITVLQWSRASDHVGRKPILLIGLSGIAVSALCFGLSRTFWGLVLSRCLCGLLNGNIGVMKSAIGELTDSTNRAEGFSFMPVVWATGATVGPLLGGTLAKPYDRFPSAFGGKFWKDYPYFLPSLGIASFAMTAFFITLVCFKESLKKKTFSLWGSKSQTDSVDTEESQPPAKPLPLRELLVYPVMISIANYASLAFQGICLEVLFPLFMAMPTSIGGLGFAPAKIGYILGAQGALTGVWQAFWFAKVIHALGERRVFITGVSMFVVLFAMFPVTSLLAQRYGVSLIVYVCIGFMVVLMAFLDMAYACIFMFITASSPNKRSLGATNGLSQTMVSIFRAIGPATAASLYSFSVQHKLLWGYAVYLILFFSSLSSVYLATYLPHEMWEESED